MLLSRWPCLLTNSMKSLLLLLLSCYGCFGQLGNVGFLASLKASLTPCTTANDVLIIDHTAGVESSGAFSVTVWVDQSFSTNINVTLTGVFVRLADTSADVGNVVVSLYSDNGANKPLTEITTPVTVANSTIPGTATDIWFGFAANYYYTANSIVHIVVRCSAAGAANMYSTSGSAYPGGTASFSVDSGSTWSTPSTTQDYKFQAWGCL